MVVKVYFGEVFSNYEHEWNQFKEFYEIINNKYGNSDEYIYVLVNFSLSNAQIDVLLLTEKGIAILDLKSYKGKIIGKIERSEGKIKLNKIQNSKKKDSDNSDNQELPCGKPAKEGFNDPYIINFVDKLKSIKEPTSIVDYGCGQGKLLCALTKLPDVAIKNISYFGVDEKTLCRYLSKLTAEKHVLFEHDPEFLKPKNFYAKNVALRCFVWVIQYPRYKRNNS